MPIRVPTNCPVHEFYHTTVWINNEIVFGRYKRDLVIDLQVAKDIVADRMNVSNGIVRPFLIDVTGVLSIDIGGRKYLAEKGCGLVSAGAICTANKLLEFVANAFILLDKPAVPAKVFTSEEAAIRWLEPFKFPN